MKREVGIDILKIVAMLSIVANHIVYWGGWGLSSGRLGLKGAVLGVFNAFCLSAVNCFVLASGWVMWRKSFKFKRIVSLWFEVEVYTILILFVSWCFDPTVSITLRDLLFSLMPLSFNRYWFFTIYVALFFFMPILNKAVSTVDKKVLCIILGALFILFCLHPFFFKNDMLHINRGYSFVWFCYLYLLGASFSCHGWLKGVPQWLSVIGIVFGCVGSFVVLKGTIFVSKVMGITAAPELFDAYNSPFLIIESVSLLAYFSNISFARYDVGGIAKSVFCVYIVHSNHFFRIMTDWNYFWRTFLDTHNLAECIVVVIISSAAIFSACVLLDVTRRKITGLLARFSIFS